jgi:hypothetical protein
LLHFVAWNNKNSPVFPDWQKSMKNCILKNNKSVIICYFPNSQLFQTGYPPPPNGNIGILQGPYLVHILQTQFGNIEHWFVLILSLELVISIPFFEAGLYKLYLCTYGTVCVESSWVCGLYYLLNFEPLPPIGLHFSRICKELVSKTSSNCMPLFKSFLQTR